VTDAAVSETGRDAAALFEFLARLVQLRSRPVRDVDEYRERLWLASLPIEPEVRTSLDQDEPDEWIAVRRPRITPAPDLPPELAGWVDPAAVRDPAVPPVVRDPAPFPVSRREPDGRLVTSTEERHLADHPGVAAAWSRYRVTWDRWAPEARRAGSVYETLPAFSTRPNPHSELAHTNRLPTPGSSRDRGMSSLVAPAEGDVPPAAPPGTLCRQGSGRDFALAPSAPASSTCLLLGGTSTVVRHASALRHDLRSAQGGGPRTFMSRMADAPREPERG